MRILIAEDEVEIAKAAAEVSGGTITAERVNGNEILFRIIL